MQFLLILGISAVVYIVLLFVLPEWGKNALMTLFLVLSALIILTPLLFMFTAFYARVGNYEHSVPMDTGKNTLV